MMKRGLGRSLSDLISPETPGEKTTLAEIPVGSIRPNPYQPRSGFDEGAIDELARSIRTHGMLQPVVVRRREDFYELITGERRWRAAMKADLATIPAAVRAVTEGEMLQLALVENLQREDINAMDAALSYKRLGDDFGMTQEDIADTVGKSRAAVANTMRLLNLPAEMQAAVRAQQISEGHARALLPLLDHPELALIWPRVVSEQPSVREVESWVRKALEPRKGQEGSGRADTKDPNVADLEGRLERALGAPVRIQHANRSNSGRIEIKYFSTEDLERLYLLLTKTYS